MPQPRIHTNDAARQRAYRERQRQARQQLAVQGLPAGAAIPTMPSRERWHELITRALAALQSAGEEMQQYWYERSELWQESQRGGDMQQDIDDLGDLADQLAEIAAHYGKES